MLARSWWRVIRLLFPFYDVDGVEFVDMRVRNRSDGVKLRTLLGNALHDLNWAGFGELVVGNVRLVIATDLGERASPAVRGYFCDFSALEFDARALACRLLWFAKYYELTAGDRDQRGRLYDGTIAWACYDAEVAFVSKFPDAATWIRFLEEHHKPSVSRGAVE